MFDCCLLVVTAAACHSYNELQYHHRRSVVNPNDKYVEIHFDEFPLSECLFEIKINLVNNLQCGVVCRCE